MTVTDRSTGWAWWRGTPPRDPSQDHRAATPLELFFDLCFVVAVAAAARSLHHAVDEAHFRDAAIGYAMVFFAIWWAWMNFTWFASAYDSDDVVHRVLVFVQIAGVLVFAAGIPRAFETVNFTVCIVGYVIMRVALVVMWCRAAASDPARRRTDLRYAAGVAVVQLGWIATIWLPNGWFRPVFAVLAALELVVPWWAERGEVTPWHPGHIAERYGLFTIIVLGETILSATVALQQSFDEGTHLGQLLVVAAAGLLIVCSMWWIYFDRPAEALVDRAHREQVERHGSGTFVWGYGHYFVFGAAAAVGAGLAVVVDQVTHHAEVTAGAATAAVALPVTIYTLGVWVLHRSAATRSRWLLAYPVCCVAMLAVAAAGLGVLAVGIVMVMLVATTVRARSDGAARPHEGTGAGQSVT
jgi:low temperature requirement protein LtrA